MRQDTLYLNAELSASDQRAVQRRVAAGELHRIRAGIATPRPEPEWPSLFRIERARALAALFPGGVVSHRSAFDSLAGPTVYLVYSYARVLLLPGLRVVLSKGAGPVEGDTRIQGRELYFPSRERMLLDAMAPPPRTDDPQYPRKMTLDEIQARLASIYEGRGEAGFLEMRDRVRMVGAQLQTPKTQVRKLDRLMGAILTRPPRPPSPVPDV